MPRYRIHQSWSEIQYYSNVVTVEAENADEARAIARDDRNMEDGEYYDSDYNGGFSIDEVECLDGEEEETLSKPKRNLPGWF